MLFLKSNFSNAQPEFDYHGFNVALPTADAAKMSKYGNQMPDLFSGKLSVSIPIFTIHTPDIDIPITLVHSGGANKVSDPGNRIGLGWHLNYGGAISRTKNGRPDDVFGWLSEAVPNEPPTRVIDDNERYIVLENYDTQPDIFHYSVNGLSGKFVYENNSDIYQTFPPTNVNIVKHDDAGGIYFFELIDDKGFTYEFSAGTFSYFPSYDPYESVDYTSSWKLTKIIPPNGDEASNENIIEFKYKVLPHRWTKTRIDTKYVLHYGTEPHIDIENYPKNGISSEESLSYHSESILESITWSEGQINLKYEIENEGIIGGDLLTSIDILDEEGVIQKTVRLDNNSYFSSNSDSKRAKLNGITFEDKNDNVIEKYCFEYNSGALPTYYSASQDHWGYYNGQNNSTLIPSFEVVPTERDVDSSFKGADRNPYFISTKATSLAKVIYPTGGYTEYTYEPNEGKMNPTLEDYFEKRLDFFFSAVPQMIIGCSDGICTATDVKSEEFVIDTDNLYKISLEINAKGLLSPEAGNPVGVTVEMEDEGVWENVLHVTLQPDDPQGFSEPRFISLIDKEIEKRFKSKHKYRIVVSVLDEVLQDGILKISLKTYEDKRKTQPQSTIKKGGGIRVKEIKDVTPLGGEIVKSFNYEDGEFTIQKMYDELKTIDLLKNIGKTIQGDKAHQAISTDFLVFSASSNPYNLESINGGDVGYGKVTVDYSGAKNGKEVYYFTPIHQINPKDFETRKGLDYNFSSGNILRKEVYNNNGDLISLIKNEYEPESFWSNALGYKMQYRSITKGLNSIGESYNNLEMLCYYRPLIYWNLKTKETSVFYNEGNKITTTTNYKYYDYPYLYHKEKITQASNSETLRTVYKYPFNDNKSFSEDLSISELENKENLFALGRYGQLMEVTEYLNEKIIFRKKVTFQKLGDEQIYPKKVFIAKGDQPYENSNITSFIYNTNGRVIEKEVNQSLESYFWNARGSKLIATIKGLGYTDAEQFLGTDLSLLAPYNRPVLPSDIQGFRKVNFEMREKLPGNVLMNTFTYDGLNGISSQTDANGISTFYHYDSYGRLFKVLDDELNPIKVLDYKIVNSQNLK
ncbi:RHS repeat protein [Flammeovirga sp. EKP202]|nr:RHS repeat protein [Flammeovirga sp. EKP202]